MNQSQENELYYSSSGLNFLRKNSSFSYPYRKNYSDQSRADQPNYTDTEATKYQSSLFSEPLFSHETVDELILIDSTLRPDHKFHSQFIPILRDVRFWAGCVAFLQLIVFVIIPFPTIFHYFERSFAATEVICASALQTPIWWFRFTHGALIFGRYPARSRALTDIPTKHHELDVSLGTNILWYITTLALHTLILVYFVLASLFFLLRNIFRHFSPTLSYAKEAPTLFARLLWYATFLSLCADAIFSIQIFIIYFKRLRNYRKLSKLKEENQVIKIPLG